MQISYFSNTYSTEPLGTVEAKDFLLTDKFKEEIGNLRQHTKGSSEFAKIKSSLPCATISGVFNHRSIEGLVTHSTLLCLDIDNINDPEGVKSELAQYPFIYYVGLSCSGKGLFAVVKIKNPSQHSEYYRAMVEFFKERDIILDKQCSDISRLRIVSYDPNPLFNEESEVWDNVLPPIERAEFTPNYHITNNGDTHQRLFLLGLDYIEHNDIDITIGRNRWLALGSMIKSMFGSCGESYFVALSRHHLRFNESDCRKTYGKLKIGDYGIGIFANACSEYHIPKLDEMMESYNRGQGV